MKDHDQYLRFLVVYGLQKLFFLLPFVMHFMRGIVQIDKEESLRPIEGRDDKNKVIQSGARVWGVVLKFSSYE